MASSPILTIAGRWRQHEHILKSLTPRERSLCCAVFYAGFASALEAMNEVAGLSEAEAVQMIGALHHECNVVAASIEQVLRNSPPS